MQIATQHDNLFEIADALMRGSAAMVDVVTAAPGIEPDAATLADLKPVRDNDDDAPDSFLKVFAIDGAPGVVLAARMDGETLTLRTLAGDPADAEIAAAIVQRKAARATELRAANDNNDPVALRLLAEHGGRDAYIGGSGVVYGLYIDGRWGQAFKASGRWLFTDTRSGQTVLLDLTPPTGPQLLSSADFVRGFRAPDYHVEGVIQRGFIYSLTASTGTGKTAIALLLALLTEQGEALADREVAQGRVIYFAGENPDDVAMRWIGMCHERGINPATLDVHFIAQRFSIPQAIDAIRENVEALGGAGLVIVDTSAAYFQGDDENGNTALGGHARDLRALTTLPGRPCVIVPAHPTKNAQADNLLPRGGGAFIAEMDGNLTLTRQGEAVRLHWQGKHRGPDFVPISFKLQTVSAPQLVDSKGRPVPTVMAVPMDATEAAGAAGRLLASLAGVAADVMAALPEGGATDAEWRKAYAEANPDDKPDTLRKRFYRARDGLIRDRLVVQDGGTFRRCPENG
jgi:hypothetical protein